MTNSSTVPFKDATHLHSDQLNTVGDTRMILNWSQNQVLNRNPTGGKIVWGDEWRPDRDLNPGRSLDRAA